jgi:AmmeMemoRadiSam system protein A
MNESNLTPTERNLLLKIARDAIENAVRKKAIPNLELSEMSQRLREQGASFVTLTIHAELRGCIGALQAYQPLALDVQEHAVAAALEDYRFPPVSIEELASLEIEISRLTPSKPLKYDTPEELINKLHPGIDGVILRNGFQRATFLPQVWETIPDPAEFLTHLCLKMGASGDSWRYKHLQVNTYQVEEFKEVEK